jgi:hypothetical protein
MITNRLLHRNKADLMPLAVTYGKFGGGIESASGFASASPGCFTMFAVGYAA